MTNLSIQYSKEIAKGLGKIAIYLPGETVQVGDIIKFPNTSKGFFSKVKPLGSFQKISSLENRGIPLKISQLSKSPDTYQFITKDATKIHMDIGASLSSTSTELPQGKGQFLIKFSTEGGLYFLAVNCLKKQLDDISVLENSINNKGQNMIWKDTFLVTSVTIAQKALIVQSNSKTSEVTIGGDIKGVQSGLVDMIANTDLQIIKEKDCSFSKPWSNDVTVFMDVIRFDEEVFGNTKNIENEISDENIIKKITLKAITPEDLLED